MIILAEGVMMISTEERGHTQNLDMTIRCVDREGVLRHSMGCSSLAGKRSPLKTDPGVNKKARVGDRGMFSVGLWNKRVFCH
jgi:hypothetical protein